MRKLPFLFAILILSFLLVSFICADLNGFFLIPTSGSIHTIGIECDTSTIAWGILHPAEQKTITINVRATGNVPVILSISAQAWQPATEPQYLSFSHDYQNQQITSTWFPITLTLTVDANAVNINQFSFNIEIVGTEP